VRRRKKKTFSKLFDSSLLRDVNITLKNMSTMSAIKPSKICASVRGSHSLGHGRKALFLSPKKSALNFRESQFQGSTRLKSAIKFLRFKSNEKEYGSSCGKSSWNRSRDDKLSGALILKLANSTANSPLFLFLSTNLFCFTFAIIVKIHSFYF